MVCPLLDKMDTRCFHKKLYYGDYLFVYASDANNFVVLIQTTPDSTDTPESEISYEEVVDTMGGDMLDELEWENGKICDYSDSSCGE